MIKLWLVLSVKKSVRPAEDIYMREECLAYLQGIGMKVAQGERRQGRGLEILSLTQENRWWKWQRVGDTQLHSALGVRQATTNQLKS